MTSVSIALATYKGAAHVRRQLDSLAAQTLLPAEIVVCDDRSPDDTVAVVEEFARSAPFPVRIHRNDAQLGYRANFMRAAGLCTGEIVAFCDQDDHWYPEKLAACVAAFDTDDTLLVCHNARIVGPGEADMGVLHSDFDPATGLPEEGTSPWYCCLGLTMVFRRSLMRFDQAWALSLDQNVEHERLAHDQWIYLLAFSLGRVVYLRQCLLDYHQHGGNTVGWGRQFSRWQRIAFRLANRAPIYAHCALAAVANARAMRAVAAASDGSWRRCAEQAAEQLDELGQIYGTRAELYRARSLPRRAGHFLRLNRAHSYDGRAAWTLSVRGFLKDLVWGVLLAPWLRTDGVPTVGSDENCRATAAAIACHAALLGSALL